MFAITRDATRVPSRRTHTLALRLPDVYTVWARTKGHTHSTRHMFITQILGERGFGGVGLRPQRQNALLTRNPARRPAMIMKPRNPHSPNVLSTFAARLDR